MANSSRSVVPLIGRILVSWIFLYSAVGQMTAFASNVGKAADKGMPLPAVAIAASLTIQFLGGLALLFGIRVRMVTWALFLFLIPTTLIFHNFWALQGAARATQIINFSRNMAIMGGLLFMATFGAGAYSIDALRAEDDR